ncbi:MAG: lipopolysaccharide biosynthesis protein [Bacteroidales bacterium]
MEFSLKSGTAKGVIWSAVERFSVQGANFILGIMIASLLTPGDYGLIAMLAIFMALSQTFIDGGFANALIQKKDRTDVDYSTVFYFNVLLSVVVYLLIYVSAPLISKFYESPELTLIARVIGITLVINSFGIVQQAIITIALDFRKQAIASLSAVLISGIIGIYMAYNGYGVWALVIQSIINNIIRVCVLWFFAKWRPGFMFSMKSFKELFEFGSKLLLSSIIHTVYTNLYTLVIGKKFAAAELGYYSRASSLALFPSYNFTSIIERAIYPVLCKRQNDLEALNESFLKYMTMACFIIFPIMVGIAVLARPLIACILNESWMDTVPLLQILCIAFMWDPVMRMNHSVINAKGRSDYFLYAEIIKKITGMIILLITIPLGVKIMCAGLILYAFCDMLIIIYYNKKVTNLGLLIQIKMILPIALLSLGMSAFVLGVERLLIPFSPIIQLLAGSISGIIFYVGISYLFKIKELKILLQLIKGK